MHYNREIEKLKKYIDDSDIVSFDIFDTLLLRNVVKPTDIFKIVESKFNKQFNEKVQFYDLRVDAEKKARQKNNEEDIEFKQIYDILESKIGVQKSDKLRNLEVEIEKKFLIPNSKMKEIYEYAKYKNKKVLIISDMYLPLRIIEQLLKRNGYESYDGLYVSSEIKKTKATGTIYKYIRKELDISLKEKWIHIGDNYQSDVVNADNNNIKGIYYRKLFDREDYIPIKNLTDSIVYSIQLNNKYSDNNSDYWTKFGMMNVAPIYIGLMFNLKKWLRGKENIYFLSRDGYIPHILYSMLKKYYDDLPDGKYIYASRRAYIYPSLANDKKKAIDFFTIYNTSFNQKLTIKEIFNNLDLDLKCYKSVLKKYSFTNIEKKITNDNVENVRKILNEIWNDINSILLTEKNILIKYLENEGVLKYRDINIFDIGWAGSTHKAIAGFTNKNVFGYYFGTIETIDKSIKNNSYGYAFNEGTPRKLRNFIIDNVMMYELIFTAPEGSLKKFKLDDDNSIIPELKDTQTDFSYDCIKTFQNSAIKIFEQVLEYSEYLEEPSKDFVLSFMENFIKNKNVVDLIEFSKIDNIVSIGESRDSKRYVTKLDYEEYLVNSDKYNREALFNLWRGAILIEDNQQRLFNEFEFKKLYNIKQCKTLIFNKYFILLKKAIKNPKKVINKIVYILRNI